MGEEYADEYKKMGSELLETMRELRKQIEQLAVDYA